MGVYLANESKVLAKTHAQQTSIDNFMLSLHSCPGHSRLRGPR